MSTLETDRFMPEVGDARAWASASIGPRDWVVPVTDACVEELEAVARRLRREPMPTILLSPSEHRLDACAAAMAVVREKLTHGIGLAVLDHLPVERWNEDENRALYWLLGSLLGRTVAQKWDGTMVYDVRDTGKPLGYGVRRSVTNLELQFHTDGAWLALPPELVGLYCLNPAREGGVSRFVSLYTVHNELRRREPRLLERLYRPFCWDRQAEHPDGEEKFSRRPVFRWTDGRLVARYYDGLIANGQELAGEALDADGRAALAAARELVDSPRLWVELVIRRGQIQYLNNHQFAHSRTDFRDAAEAHLKRHMIRLWNREEGARSFHGGLGE